jgi:tRNA threonylcarbamoyladenosine biosynthesis protein TsaB
LLFLLFALTDRKTYNRATEKHLSIRPLMESHPLILGLETATLSGSVSLVQGENVRAARVGNPETSHSNTLLRDIQEVLDDANVSIHDVGLFAAAVGPGSFTGLRIGLATAKALAATLNKPCVGIPTLHAVARAAGASKATVALLPAGRGELFAQLLSVSEDGEVRELDAPAHLAPEKMIERYASLSKLIWAGEGILRYRDLINRRQPAFQIGDQPQGWTIAPLEKNLAQYVALLSQKPYQSGKVSTPDSLEALYVRPSDAELKANVVNS